MGTLIGRLTEHARALSQPDVGTAPLRVYSCHDSTLVALLANLALALPDDEWPAYTTEWPPYASVFEVETWGREGSEANGGFDVSARFVFNGVVLPHEGRAGEHGLVQLR